MLKTAKVVGLNSDTNAALALNLPDSGFFAIVYCSVEDAFSRARQALSEAETTFSSTSDSVSDSLTKTLQTIKESLKDTSDLNIIIARVQRDPGGAALYLLYEGSLLKAYLLREGKKTNLCNMAESGQLISGILQAGDRMILTTESLLELLGDDFENLNKIPIENFEDEVTAKMPEAEDFPVAAIAIEEESEKIISEDDEEIKEVENPVAEKQKKGKIILPAIKKLLKLIYPRSKKGVFILGVIILILVLSLSVFIYQQKKNLDNSTDFNKNLKQAKEFYDKALSSKDSDAALAANSLISAQKALETLLKVKPGDQEALSLKKEIENNSGSILKIFSVTDFPVWLDLNLIKTGFSTKSLSLSHGNLLLSDVDKKVLVKINTKTKAQEILAGEEGLGEVKLSSLNGNVAWVFSSDKGIVKIEDKNKPVVVAKTDEEWGDIVDIYGFAGNIYLLDDLKNQVWKYLPITSGYSDKRSYLQSGVKADFTNVKKMHIDSSVWLLKGNGEILKFTQGAPDFFSLNGLDKGIKEPKSFFASDETENLYLLDSGNNRLLVLDKKGVYKTQYQGDKLGSFSDLVVDEEGKKVYLLDGSKIYWIELK